MVRRSLVPWDMLVGDFEHLLTALRGSYQYLSEFLIWHSAAIIHTL